MLYDFKCVKCNYVQEDTCMVAEMKTHAPKCEKCGAKCKYIFTPTVVQFALKDGPSGSYPSKGERFKKFRTKQHELAGKRQRDRYGDVHKLVPNFAGQETGSWREAQHQASQKKGLDAAATYSNLVSSEKKIS